MPSQCVKFITDNSMNEKKFWRAVNFEPLNSLSCNLSISRANVFPIEATCTSILIVIKLIVATCVLASDVAFGAPPFFFNTLSCSSSFQTLTMKQQLGRG